MLNELLPGVRAPEIMLRGLCSDSRKVEEGDLFCAIGGEQVDGRDFIQSAVSKGAIAVLSDAPLPRELPNVPVIEIDGLGQQLGRIASRFFGDPSKQLPVFAVTGTNGKTSFTQLLSQALSAGGVKCGMIGTMGFGLPGQLKDPGLTTPPPIDLQRRIRMLVDEGCGALVLEASSHGLVQGRLNGVAVTTAVLTNITHDHLDYHKSFDAYRRAKEQLFMLESVRNAVINLDDDYASTLISHLPEEQRVITFSLEKEADIRVRKLDPMDSGVEASLRIHNDIIDVHIPLFGTFNVQNVLAVVATLVAIGWETEQIRKALTRLQPVAGRMDARRWAGKPTLIVDYAHTPDALEKALLAVREHFPGNPLTCVFGCGGARDRSKRPVMGEIAARLADRVVLTSDNPRSEDPGAIIKDIRAGITSDEPDVVIRQERDEAIREAIRVAVPGEVILVAGKGHEDYQELASGKIPFSDYQVIEEAMRAAVHSGEEN